MPSNWLIFDRIRALTRQHRIYRTEKVFQDQSSLDKLTSGGDFLDFNQQAAILDQTNLQINRLERYRDFEAMDIMGEISLALDLYADEGCVIGETIIPLLNGTYPTIAELAEKGPDYEFWVYAYDQQLQKYVPAKAHGARVTGENVPIVCVTLDDGTKIKCTSNHLFMLNDGSFKSAGDLRPNESLKPLYKKIRYRGKNHVGFKDSKPYKTASEYEFIFNGKHFKSTHRWVYDYFHVEYPEIVHHVDFNSRNNIPKNLEGLTIDEHNLIHQMNGDKNPSFNHITLTEIIKISEQLSKPLNKEILCSACDIGERVINRVLAENNLTWSEFKLQYSHCKYCNNKLYGIRQICNQCRRNLNNKYHQNKKYDHKYRERRKLNKRNNYKSIKEKQCKNCNLLKPIIEFNKNKCAYSPYCNSCRPFICQNRYLKKSFSNHKVISVIACGLADKVYDIEVPKYHCFAAGDKDSWVIIHNSLTDPERKHTLVIRARNRRLKRELEDLFYNILRWDTQCRPTIRYLCKYGDAPFEIIPDENRSGVSALKFMNVYNFTRIETRYGDLIGFFYMDALWPRPVFLHPWQAMHLRLTSFENFYAPYGISIINGGRRAFKQLRLMEDAALIYRITRSSEKRKFTIPVGMIPPKEVPEYMQMIARTFKRQRFYNPTTGTFDERYSPLVQEDDFFLPRRPDGTGPDIDILPGAENLDQIADIEYFKKKMIAPTKIPFARVGIGEGAGEASEKSLSQSHSEFAKAVQWVQREVATGLTKVAIVHLALRGYSVEDLKGFELALTATSAMEELYRIETWQTRVSVMADLKELGWFPKEWIVTHFTDLSPDEIEELKDIEEVESGAGGGGGGLDIPGSQENDGGPELNLGVGSEDAVDPNNPNPQVQNDQDNPQLNVPPIEGFDYKAEKRVLVELMKNGRRNEAKLLVEKWARKLGKLEAEEANFNSGFSYLIESKELDGLSKNKSNKKENDIINENMIIINEELMINDPNVNEHDLLVGWSVDAETRNETIKEVYDVLMMGVKKPPVDDESDITSNDIPEHESNGYGNGILNESSIR